MRMMFTDSQIDNITLAMAYHVSRHCAIGENEKAALHDMMDGYELRIDQLGSLVDFFGRMIDFDLCGNDLVLDEMVKYMHIALRTEQRRIFNI